MKTVILLLSLFTGPLLPAQVIILGKPATNQVPAVTIITPTAITTPAPATPRVTLNLGDLSFMPMVIQSRETKAGAGTTVTETTLRTPLADGTLFDWRTVTTTSQRVGKNEEEAKTVVVEQDRQGGSRTVQEATVTTTKTLTGTESKETRFERNASGILALASVTETTTKQNPNRSVESVAAEQLADLNGNLRASKVVKETMASPRPNESEITRLIEQVDHLDGTIKVTKRELETARTQGNVTSIERTIQKPDGSGWRDLGKVRLTETKAPDGSLLRETIEYGPSLYSRYDPRAYEPLAPQRKVVEQELRKPDGTTETRRQVFRYSVNGDWAPVTFSSRTDFLRSLP